MIRYILTRTPTVLVLLLVSFNAYSECNPLVGGYECDFKNEDTQLAFNQPGLYFAKEDRVDELLKQGKSFIDNYMASVKTTGDLATRYMIAPTAVSMTVVEAQQAIGTAAVLANDPFSLKDLYTDVACQIYWDVIEVATGINRTCPTTAELLTQIDKLQELDGVRQDITDIVLNPNLVLGEQWTDAIADVQALRDKLQSPDTFGRNIPLPDIDAFFNDHYPDLASLIAAPTETIAQIRARVEELNDSRRDTIREHMLATKQNHLNLVNNDVPELERLSDMSSRAVGRMQASEIDNMLTMQKVQGFQTMTEEVMNVSTLYMQDMADSNGDAARAKAFAIKSAEPIPAHEAVIGNGKRYTP